MIKRGFFGTKVVTKAKVGFMLTDSSLLLAIAGPNPRFVRMPLDGQPWEFRVSQLLKEHHLAHASVTVVLEPAHYQQIPLEKPAVPDNELAGALPWSIKDFTNKPIEQLALDYYDLRTSPSSRPRIQVIAAERSLIQAWGRVLLPGCQLKTVTIDELGLTNLFNPQEGTVDVLLFQLPGRDLSLLVVYKGQLCFSRALRGFTMLVQDAPESWSADVLDNLLLELQRSFDYLLSQLKLPEVSHLYLALDMTDPAPLLRLLKQNFTMSVQLLVNPAVVSGMDFLPLYGALQETVRV